MSNNNDQNTTLTPNTLIDTMIRLGAIILLALFCVRVFSPFANLMIWALVLGIAIYPLHQRLANRMGGRQGRAATLMVLVTLLLVGGPTIMLGSSFANHVQDLHTDFQNNELTIKKPKPSVANWPVVGDKVYTAWSSASDNLPAYVEANKAQLDAYARKGLAMAKNTASSILLFLAAFIVSGIMMAYGESGAAAMQRIFSRFAGPGEGPRLQNLSVMTVRSVAVGVIGVAFIQAVLLGVGFLGAGVPAAGILAIITIFTGILQLPALLISLPVIAWIWMGGDASTTSNIIWTIYLVIAGLSDNVLKPMLLGRGVDVPMPVILIGALGGMVTGGFIGMFLGAVILALGYQIFMDWVARGSEPSDQEAPASE